MAGSELCAAVVLRKRDSRSSLSKTASSKTLIVVHTLDPVLLVLKLSWRVSIVKSISPRSMY